MGKTTRSKQAQESERVDSVLSTFRANSLKVEAARKQAEQQDLMQAKKLVYEFSGFALRDPATWVNKLRTKNIDKMLLTWIGHTYKKYQVPKFLDKVWKVGNAEYASSAEFEYRWWWIAITQGKSFYKEHGKDLGLSRMDCHHFLVCPIEEYSPNQALWHAVVLGRGGSMRVASKICRSKLGEGRPSNEFWRNFVGWCVNNEPKDASQISDIVDFIQHRINQNPQFTMRGRTLEAVLEQMKDWHYELRRMKHIGGGNWEGMPVADCDIAMGPEDNQQIWHFTQIKTGNRLAAEGSKMHHCVSVYKAGCILGNVFIWSVSMTHKNKTKDYLTMQILIQGNRYRISQCRGFANRFPNNYEKSMVALWAKKEGIHANSYY